MSGTRMRDKTLISPDRKAAINKAATSNKLITSNHMEPLLRLFLTQMALLRWAWMLMLQQG
jgi:hypothetical protein